MAKEAVWPTLAQQVL